MKTAMRAVAAVLLVLLGLAGVWLGWAQAQASRDYRDDPRSVRASVASDDASRGRIVTADGVVVAEDGPDGIRSYPRGAVYAHLVGYDAPSGRSGLELTRFSQMQSRDDGSITAWLRRLLGDDLDPPDVYLTVDDDLQRVAADALGDRTGAVVALDPSTGAVLAYLRATRPDLLTLRQAASQAGGG